jgi:hypothetical protein
MHREHQHRRPGSYFPYAARGLKPVHHRHSKIQDDEVGEVLPLCPPLLFRFQPRRTLPSPNSLRSTNARSGGSKGCHRQ